MLIKHGLMCQDWARTHYVVKENPEPLGPLPSIAEHWDYWHVLTYLVCTLLDMESRTVPGKLSAN